MPLQFKGPWLSGQDIPDVYVDQFSERMLPRLGSFEVAALVYRGLDPLCPPPGIGFSLERGTLW